MEATEIVTPKFNVGSRPPELPVDQAMKNAQEQAMAQARSYVRDNPVTALGIAVAAGFLLSRLLHSR